MQRGQPPHQLAVVIPTLNESSWLPPLLGDIARLRVRHEVIVADGGSQDGTGGMARSLGARVVTCGPGRARQLNAGARASSGPWLLFLHADTRLAQGARGALEQWLAGPQPQTSAVFRFAVQKPGAYWRFIEFGQRLRERLFGLAYGDQGLLVAREDFEAVGGYPLQPLMEDVEMVRRLRQRGRVVTLPAPLFASTRRYEREGRLYSWLRNALFIVLYRAGVSAAWLARWYRAEPFEEPSRATPDESGGAELLVFAKAPEPGRVKTRLAAALGAERAAAVYRALGRRVVRQVAGGPYRTVVCYEPVGAGAAIRSWLGKEGGVLELEAQVPGDLGRRLEAAFAAAFERGARAVVAIGTDAPAVDRAVVLRALDGLQDHDLVLGPAADGGYYLVGLRRPVPGVFRRIPWSTPGVLAATRQRARELRLRVVELGILRDVDTLEDLRGAP